ncbi:MAG: hypothetical protein KJ749_12560, partial [Planctomycetes bacterium]|nr:hypothetical protein [Planctomycetota bacterium]
MFLKRISIRKNGSRHTYWALVKSVRTYPSGEALRQSGASPRGCGHVRGSRKGCEPSAMRVWVGGML